MNSYLKHSKKQVCSGWEMFFFVALTMHESPPTGVRETKSIRNGKIYLGISPPRVATPSGVSAMKVREFRKVPEVVRHAKRHRDRILKGESSSVQQLNRRTREWRVGYFIGTRMFIRKLNHVGTKYNKFLYISNRWSMFTVSREVTHTVKIVTMSKTNRSEKWHFRPLHQTEMCTEDR